jgi:non-ribosomal peptide synthetase component E (peptide arylation enzyme)
MDPIRKRELKRQAWMRLAAQRRRAGLLRGRVVVISLLCFAVLWGIVFAQMATGNDPVLAGKEKASKTRTVASAKRRVEKKPVEEAEPAEVEPLEEEFFEEPVEVESVEEPEVIEEAELFEEEPEPLVTSQS